jgi:hypothetical protein
MNRHLLLATRYLFASQCLVIVLLCGSTVSAGEWKLLFNGKDLTGWQVVDAAKDSWRAVDGMLQCTGGGGWISTSQQYANFELELEFRVPEGGNSGVFLRAPHEGNPAYQGMEIQVLDDHAEQYAKLKPTQYTGSIYDVVAAQPRVTKKPGEWQKMVIVAKGRHVTVNLNGTKIIDANLDDHPEKNASHPGLKRETGYLGLQNHGSPLDYRNLRIRTFE